MDPEPKEFVIVFAVLGGLILAFIVRAVVQRRTREPHKEMREVAFGSACFGLGAVITGSVYRVVNDRGGQEYHVCGPQTAYDSLLLWYGAAMILTGVASFVLPRLLGILLIGCGAIFGGVLNWAIAALAMAGAVQLRSASGDGFGRLVEEYPVLALVPGLILVCAGIGLVCWPCSVWIKALRRSARRR
jgi:hypothetical protein